MYNERLLDHFQNPRNVGELSPPAVTVEVTNPACGDILRLSALIDGNVLLTVAYKVRGCTASIAAGSALTTLIEGKSLTEASLVTPAEVESALGGLPPASQHAAVLCCDAVRALIRRYGQ
jgi:nitrogen fixation NifU-like protein